MLLSRVLITLGLGVFLTWSYLRGLRICAQTGASRRVFTVLWGAYAYGWYSFLDHKGDKHSTKVLALATILMCAYMFFYINRFLINLTKRGALAMPTSGRKRVDWVAWGWSAVAAFIAAFMLTFFTMLIHVPSRDVVTFYLFGPNGALFAAEWVAITVLIRRMLYALERHR